jgi:hypothetical protein
MFLMLKVGNLSFCNNCDMYFKILTHLHVPSIAEACLVYSCWPSPAQSFLVASFPWWTKLNTVRTQPSACSKFVILWVQLWTPINCL